MSNNRNSYDRINSEEAAAIYSLFSLQYPRDTRKECHPYPETPQFLEYYGPDGLTHNGTLPIPGNAYASPDPNTQMGLDVDDAHLEGFAAGLKRHYSGDMRTDQGQGQCLRAPKRRYSVYMKFDDGLDNQAETETATSSSGTIDASNERQVMRMPSYFRKGIRDGFEQTVEVGGYEYRRSCNTRSKTSWSIEDAVKDGDVEALRQRALDDADTLQNADRKIRLLEQKVSEQSQAESKHVEEIASLQRRVRETEHKMASLTHEMARTQQDKEDAVKDMNRAFEEKEKVLEEMTKSLEAIHKHNSLSGLQQTQEILVQAIVDKKKAEYDRARAQTGWQRALRSRDRALFDKNTAEKQVKELSNQVSGLREIAGVSEELREQMATVHTQRLERLLGLQHKRWDKEQKEGL
ncbi:hypothetical protein BDW62DRAFT_204542 [Aspergillus aurantiobrunneus]